MSLYLVVKNPFETYLRGDLITDMHKVEQILKSEIAHCVTKVVPATSLGGQS